MAAIRAAQPGHAGGAAWSAMPWGICLNWGCIPTKALLRNAEIYHLMQHSADFGLYCDNLRFDFSRVIARSRQVAERLSQGIAFLMRKNKIQVFRGTGRSGWGRCRDRARCPGRTHDDAAGGACDSAGDRSTVPPACRVCRSMHSTCC